MANKKQRPIVKGVSAPKALGTRLGTLQDWRGGSGKSGKPSGRYGSAVRDGR